MSIKISLICSGKDERDELVAQAASIRAVELTAHIGTAKTLLAVLKKERPDVVLLDLPEWDAQTLEQIEGATLKAPGTPVVVVSPDRSLEFLKRAMRAGVRDILPAPMSAATVQRAVDYVHESQSLGSRFGDSHGGVLAFVPVKGGAGATFLATNLGYALSMQRKQVLVIDLNLYFGDAALYLTDRKPVSSVVDLARQTHRMDESLLDASVLKAHDNLHVLAAPTLPYRIEEVTPEALEQLVALARGQYDFVILDMSRMLDAATVKALDLADKIYLTVQASLPALQDARRIVSTFKELGYGPDKLWPIVNRYDKGGVIRPEEVERVASLNVKRTIPERADAVSASVNQGVPLMMLAPRDPVARALQDWAQELSPMSVKAGRSWFQTLTGVF